MPRSRFFAGMTGALILAACSSQSGLGYDPDKGLIVGPSAGETAAAGSPDDSGGWFGLGKIFGSSESSSKGYVVGDEPEAVTAGATALRQGGSAADAATAMYFTLAVTYPVAAGLGGGGLCVVYDAASGRSQAIDFLARDASRGGAYAVPGNVRGFATLQTAFGRLPWQRDVAFGESKAATGFPISEALAARLQDSQNVVRLDTNLAAEFLDESGQVKPAGTVVSNPALAGTFAIVREQGADGLYGGTVAQKIVNYSASQGGAISLSDLADYRAGTGDPQIVTVGGLRAYLPPSSIGAGSFAAAMLSHLVNADGTPKTDGNPAGATAQAVKETLTKFGVISLPQDLGATGFAALDKNGEAVACAVTMNGPFGSGHTAEGTGVTLANSPADETGLAAAFLTPLLAAKDREIELAGAGAGGPNGTASIVYALLRLALGNGISKPGDLRSTGAAPYDTVNAIACKDGVCAALSDPAAHGLGAAAGG